MIEDLWYKNGVFYRLSVGTYMDANGDGIGDFKDLLHRLDYLQILGITTIWLMPFQPSPGKDDGYDIRTITASIRDTARCNAETPALLPELKALTADQICPLFRFALDPLSHLIRASMACDSAQIGQPLNDSRRRHCPTSARSRATTGLGVATGA
jgi:hypothetical protein